MTDDPLSDDAYVEAHRDTALAHDLLVGHSLKWIRVLQGDYPGILIPKKCTEDQVAELRKAVSYEWPHTLPQAPYDPQFDQFLNPRQLDDIQAGKPILVAPFLERPLKLDIQRRNTALQHRVRTALTYGISTTLETLGRLQARRQLAIDMTKETAVDEALLFISPNNILALAGILAGKSKFGMRYSKTNAVIKKLKAIQVRGSLAENQDHYGGPEVTRQHILDEIETVKRADARPENAPLRATNAAIRFHRQVATGLIRCWEHDGEHTTAHREWSSARKNDLPVSNPIRWTFMGSARVPVELVDLMSLALFDMPDAIRVFQVRGDQKIYLEAAAALGSLFRGRLTRIAAEVVYILNETIEEMSLRTPEASSGQSPLTPQQFLYYALCRVGSVEWWREALQSAYGRELCLYLRRGGAYQKAYWRDNSRGRQLRASIRKNPTIIRLKALLRTCEAKFALAPIPSVVRSWFYSPSTKVATLDLGAICRFQGEEVPRIIECAIEATAAALLCKGFPKHQATHSFLPTYYRSLVAIAVATSQVAQDIFPHRCEEKELDLHHYQRFLTDAEFELYSRAGRYIGDQIRVALELEPKHDFSGTEIEDVFQNGAQPTLPRQGHQVSTPEPVEKSPVRKSKRRSRGPGRKPKARKR